MAVAEKGRVNLRWDSGALRLCGWAAPTEAADAEAPLTLSLSVGGVLLGALRRDVKRPDVDTHLGYPVPPPGFSVADYGIAAFARLCGLGEVAVTVEGPGDSAQHFPLSTSPDQRPYFSPLGTRHGIGKVVRLADLWLEGSRNLNIRLDGSPKIPKTIDAYQRGQEGGLLAVATDQPVGSLTAVVRMTLFNPFAPLLLVFKGEDQAIDAIDVLPFPSLVRGGPHSAERLIAGHGGDEVADTATLSGELLAAWFDRSERRESAVTTVEFDPAADTGLEPGLNPDLIAWMASGLGIDVRFGDNSAVSGPADWLIGSGVGGAADGTAGGHVLRLPADSIPTISALLNVLPTNARAESVIGSMGVTDWHRHGPVWSVWMPPLTRALDDLQLAGSQHIAPILTVRNRPGGRQGEQEVALGWPLAIATRPKPSPAARVSPFETSAESTGPLLRTELSAQQPVSVLVLFGADKTSPVPLLESLARQEGASIRDLVICRPHGASDQALLRALNQLFGDRHAIVAQPATAGRLEQIAAARDSLAADTALIVDAATVIPDVRFLKALVSILSASNASSVGCLLRAADEKMAVKSAGYSLTEVSMKGVPALSFDTIDPTVLRGPATYPVVANSLSALVTTKSALNAMSPDGSAHLRPETDDLLFGLQQIDGGGLNLCSTIVSAFTSTSSRPSGLAVSSPYRLSVETIARIAGSTTLVQRLA